MWCIHPLMRSLTPPPCLVNTPRHSLAHSLTHPHTLPHQDLDFEFLNQEGFPDFAGGEASLLVDDDFDSPFTMVMEPDNYLAAMEDAQQAALQGRIAQVGPGDRVPKQWSVCWCAGREAGGVGGMLSDTQWLVIYHFVEGGSW